MIETLTLRNFKVLREVEVRLRPLTLIVGPNASGKSTILEALAREGASTSHRVARMAGHDRSWDPSALSLALAGLYRQHPERFRDVVDRLRKIISGIRDVRLLPAELGTRGDELVFDTTSAEGVPAHSVGVGILIALELLTVLSAPEPPQLVLIDDLERGLHPKALGELIRQFRLLQEQNPELQIVATSHSPYLLDYVKAEEVLLTSLDQDGYAVVKSLTEHPEYERWKDLMAPGEFWSTVGESWVTEQQAGAGSARSPSSPPDHPWRRPSQAGGLGDRRLRASGCPRGSAPGRGLPGPRLRSPLETRDPLREGAWPPEEREAGS